MLRSVQTQHQQQVFRRKRRHFPPAENRTPGTRQQIVNTEVDGIEMR